MNPTPAAKPVARLAVDLATPLPLSEHAKALLAPGMTVRQYFDTLAAKPELAEDTIRFLAAALPKREAVWWGLLCLRAAMPTPSPTVHKTLAVVESWVKDPSDANRRACGAAAEAAGYNTAPGCLANAAFWSGGSLTPPHLAPVPPRDDLTGVAVTGALLLAAVIDPAQAAALKGRFVALGADVAAGKSKW